MRTLYAQLIPYLQNFGIIICSSISIITYK